MRSPSPSTLAIAANRHPDLRARRELELRLQRRNLRRLCRNCLRHALCVALELRDSSVTFVELPTQLTSLGLQGSKYSGSALRSTVGKLLQTSLLRLRLALLGFKDISFESQRLNLTQRAVELRPRSCRFRRSSPDLPFALLWVRCSDDSAVAARPSAARARSSAACIKTSALARSWASLAVATSAIRARFACDATARSRSSSSAGGGGGASSLGRTMPRVTGPVVEMSRRLRSAGQHS